jgi:rhomboid protease GluP
VNFPPSASPASSDLPPPPLVRLRAPTHRVWATYVFLGLIGLVFAAQLALDPSGREVDPIIIFGAKENTLIAQGQVWRLVTAIFIHVGLLHVGFNAFSLYNIGRMLETAYGPLRFSLMFLLTGVAGTVMSLWFNPNPAVGASGAIFGLIGAEGILLYRNRALLGERGRGALQNVIFVILINLAFGLQSGIDNWGHLGGLLGGVLLGWAIGPIWEVRTEPYTPPAIVDVNPFTIRPGLLTAGFALGLIVLTGLFALR